MAADMRSMRQFTKLFFNSNIISNANSTLTLTANYTLKRSSALNSWLLES